MLLGTAGTIVSLVTAGIVGSIGLTSPKALAYTERPAGDATVEGMITFVGTAPAPSLFPFAKFPNSKYCAMTENDGEGNRVVRRVIVNDGRLQDVVVYIRNIPHGKAFRFSGTDVIARGCRFLVQGPSSVVGVVVRGEELRVFNDDNDPLDPKAVDGVLHNPHAFEQRGDSLLSLFNLPLPEKNQTIRKRYLPKYADSTVMIQCDQHNYEYVYFLRVESPYYAIVGPAGTYSVDQVPAGTYEMIAWHPRLGTLTKTIDVGKSGKVMVNFEFSFPPVQ
jgi:hypothetical protein